LPFINKGVLMINPHKMRKDELIKYMTGRCKHSHLYCEHPSCWTKEQNNPQRIGFLDIETSGFQGNYHIMLSYAIKEAGENGKIYARHITAKELRSDSFDKNLTKDCLNDMLNFDKIVTYYGTGFDIPFLRTRALKYSLDFPLYGAVQHSDCYYMVKYKLKLNRNSLEAATKHLGIEGKNHVVGDEWMRAYMHCDKKSLNYILEHNIKDVVILEKLYFRLKDYIKESKKSI